MVTLTTQPMSTPQQPSASDNGSAKTLADETAKELVQLFKLLADETRLRILHLLQQGPLCVCHFQSVLEEPQVKISKHLAYLRERGLVEAERQGHWMIYRLPARPARELAANLACLQDCVQEEPVFQRDLARLARAAKRIAASSPCGCPE